MILITLTNDWDRHSNQFRHWEMMNRNWQNCRDHVTLVMAKKRLMMMSNHTSNSECPSFFLDCHQVLSSSDYCCLTFPVMPAWSNLKCLHCYLKLVPQILRTCHSMSLLQSRSGYLRFHIVYMCVKVIEENVNRKLNSCWHGFYSWGSLSLFILFKGFLKKFKSFF